MVEAEAETESIFHYLEISRPLLSLTFCKVSLFESILIHVCNIVIDWAVKEGTLYFRGQTLQYSH